MTKKLTVGHRYTAVIDIGDVEHHVTLTLKRPQAHVADRGADLGC